MCLAEGANITVHVRRLIKGVVVVQTQRSIFNIISTNILMFTECAVKDQGPGAIMIPCLLITFSSIFILKTKTGPGQVVV